MIKKCFTLVATLLLVLALTMPANAAEYKSLELGDEISLPNNIGYEIHDTCCGHDWFEQYHAREDGWFIVLSIVANKNIATEQVFDRVYIDIYDAEGVFQKELSLNNTDANIAARLTSEAVEIYTTRYYLSYNMVTEELTCHYTPDDYVRTSNLYEQLRQTQQQVGDWQYQSSGFPRMYSTLTRENDGYKQTILKMKGSNLQFPNVIPYIASSAAAIVIVGYFVKRKRRETQED